MKKQKIILVAVLAMALVMLMACGLLSKVESIEFTKAPAASYKLNEKVEAKNFTVTISFVGGNPAPQTIALTDSRLTVEGLVDGRLDTATVGRKTLKVTYQGVSITIYYNVMGEVATKTWADATEADGDGYALYQDLMNSEKATIDLTANKIYDLSKYQWKSVDVNRALTINGNGATIKGMTITSENAVSFDTVNNNSAAGFLGIVKANVTVKNLTFDEPTVNYIHNFTGDVELSKNYGVVIGRCESGTVVIDSVTVKDAYMRGMGRVAGIVGATFGNASDLTVKNCNVKVTIAGYNPVAESSGDGEGDKLAGILGQQNGGTGSKLTVTGNTVDVIINGTRDLGGVVAFIGGAETNISGNTVKATSIITASVLGGMLPNKGTRNVGGIVGTLESINVTYAITGNTVQEGVTVISNSVYEDSTTGKFVGGFRRNAGTFKVNDKTYVITIAENYFTDVKREVPNLNADLAAVNHGA